MKNIIFFLFRNDAGVETYKFSTEIFGKAVKRSVIAREITWSGWAEINWATSWKNLFMQYVNNKGADQPAHSRSLMSTFVVRCLDSIIPLVSTSKISSLYPASVAAQAGLSLPWSQIPKAGFLMMRLNLSIPAVMRKLFMVCFVPHKQILLLCHIWL